MAIVGKVRPLVPAPRYSMPARKSISKALRQRVYEKCGGRCGYCGAPLPARWCVDHVHAHYLGGEDRFDNLMPACTPCNMLKSTHSIEGFRYEIEQQIDRARRSSVNYRTAERFGLIQQKATAVTFYFERMGDTARTAKDADNG